MSTKISQTRYMILGSAIILAVLIAGCTAGPSGAPSTPTVTMTTTPTPISTTVPQTTQATTPMATVNQTPTSPPVMAIAIQNYSFNPKTVTIKVGTTVTWTNLDSGHHMISNQGTAMFGPGKIFLSKVLGKGDTYSFTFTTAGVYPYFCVIYPTMLGTITVT